MLSRYAKNPTAGTTIMTWGIPQSLLPPCFILHGGAKVSFSGSSCSGPTVGDLADRYADIDWRGTAS